MTSTVAELVASVSVRLAEAGVPTPLVDAELLIGHALGWSRTELLLRGAAAVDDHATEGVEQLVTRRASREPLQLIVGQVGFRHIDVEVRPGVFIPRPETEVLAGHAIDRAPAGGIVVEPCTGTGAVACAVALEASPTRVIATDVSPLAVSLASANARRLGAAVEVVEGDLLVGVDPAVRGRVDVLVCNPPYLAERELAGLEPEVTEWDPPASLVAGPSGHEVVERLIAEAPVWLRAGGWLLMELDPARAGATAERLRAAGFAGVTLLRDLAGRDRIVGGST